MQIIHWFVSYIDYAYLIRLSDVINPSIWPLPLQSIYKYSNAHNFNILTDLDETGIKNHGLLRAFILNIVIIRVAIRFKDGISIDFGCLATNIACIVFTFYFTSSKKC